MIMVSVLKVSKIRILTGFGVKLAFVVIKKSILDDATKNKPAAQAAGQTLPDATPPVGKIHPFSKIALTF